MPLNFDLHAHSSVSDGLLSPADLVAYAAAKGVNVLALTDHDDIGGLAEAQAAAETHNITLINGVEISVTWKKRTLHIVGLNIDPNNLALQKALALVRIARDERAQQMGEGPTKSINDCSIKGNVAAFNNEINLLAFAHRQIADHARILSEYLIKRHQSD